jgi:hypothetical protein
VYWSYRNGINYVQAGILASLSHAATNSRMMLKNFYQKGLNNIKKGTDDKAKAFIIPKNQRDRAMAAYLVNQLRAQATDVYKAESGKNQGDYVVFTYEENNPYSPVL